MKAICVDDEWKIMKFTVEMCRQLPQIDEAEGFVRPREALDYLAGNPVDLALLDIDMPEMNGIELASEIKKLWPDTYIIFLTAYSEYAFDAFSVRAGGYLLKPVTEEMLAAEVAYAFSKKKPAPIPHVMVRTFGGFDVFVDGKLVTFSQAKCKEFFAYLVDRQGNSVTRKEVFSILWEDTKYDRSRQKQMDNIIRSMRKTLEEYDIGEIFELQRGTMRIRPELFTCDAYQFFRGDVDAVNAYRGEYMSAYSWASITESYMDFKTRRE